MFSLSRIQRRGGRRTALLCKIALIPVLTCGGTTLLLAEHWLGEEVQVDGVLHVKNPHTAIEAPLTIQPRQLWHIGTEDGEDDLVLGRILAVETDRDGNAYLLDNTYSTVRVVAPDGTYQGDLGREGEGPGEFRNPMRMVLMPDGKVAVVQMMPSKIVLLEPDGLPAGTFPLPGESRMRFLDLLAASADMVVLSFTEASLGEGGSVITHQLLTLDQDGTVQHVLCEKKEEQSGPGLSLNLGGGDSGFLNNWVLGDDGRVYVTEFYDKYEIQVFGKDGQLDRIIERQYDSLKHPREVYEELKAQQEDLPTFSDNVEVSEVNPYARDIRQLIPRPGGTLWVASSEGGQERSAGQLGLFDEYDAAGRFQRQIKIEADYDWDRDRYVVEGNHLFILKEVQNAPATTSTSGGGGMQMVMISGGRSSSDDDDEDPGEDAPFSVICYELP
ncbi:MAG: hypothetical protein ABIF77_10935 [bacterium]